MEARNNNPNNRNPTILAKSFESKFRSKKDIYLLLTVDAQAYLPSNDDVTIYFLKDIVSGTKKCKFIITSY